MNAGPRRARLTGRNAAARIFSAAVLSAALIAGSAPALASADSAAGLARPAGLAGHRAAAPSYLDLNPIQLGALPESIWIDPVSDMIYVGEVGKARKLSTAVINGRTDKVVARLSLIGRFALDSRIDAFYVPTGTGVAVLAGRTHKVTRRVPLPGAYYAVVDPRTGHVFVAVHHGKSSSIVMLSDRTNKIVGRVSLPAADHVDQLAASPATGVIYAGTSALRQASAVWIIGTRGAKVLAKINTDEQGGFAVDDQNHLLSVLLADSLLVIDGRTHKARAPVNVTTDTADTVAAEAATPLTHTFYAAVECDPDSWVTAVSEQTGKVAATINLTGTEVVLEAMVADPARSVVFAVDYTGGDVTIINARTNTIITTLSTGFHPGEIAVNPVTGRAYIANPDHTLTVLAPGAASARLAGGPADVSLPTTVSPVTGRRRGTCG